MKQIWMILTGIASTGIILFFDGTEFSMLYEFGDVRLNLRNVLDD